LCGAFQIVLDFGTQEHIFNNTAFLKNVFYLMSVDGYYFFDLPANNYCEHGFRQYSPTFFYDFCAQNYSQIKLAHLCLYSSGIYLDTIPLYRKLDRISRDVISSACIRSPKQMLSAGRFTGICISLFNRIHSVSSVIGVINKTRTTSGVLDMAPSQCVYRNFPLYEVLPRSSSTASFEKYLNKLMQDLLKKILLALPARLTISVLVFTVSCKPRVNLECD